LNSARQKIANYPGVTVEKRTGTVVTAQGEIEIVDLPGAYSLSTHSLDEQVARDFILEEQPDLLINVVDASNLGRNLYLTVQLLELGMPMIVALNMGDLAEQRGVKIDAAQLEAELGLPVVPIMASRKRGVKDLIQKAAEMATEDSKQPEGSTLAEGKQGTPRLLSYGQHVDSSLGQLEKALEADPHLFDRHIPARWWALKCLEEDAQVLGRAQHDGAAGMNVSRIVRQCRLDLQEATQADNPARAISATRYGYVDDLCKRVLKREDGRFRRWADRIDQVAIHPVAGWLLMVLVFFVAYTITFSGASSEILAWAGIPGSLVSWVEGSFAWLGEVVVSVVPPGVLQSLLVNGIIGGVGGVMSFVPIIFLMFFVISLIDDSGYMARLAYILDAPLRIFGLQGKSALAMAVSGGVAGGCAVPGIMATRTLDDPRERLATILVCPFLNCGAKLPVYAMLIAAFFQRWEAMMMLALTLISWTFAMTGAWMLRRVVVRGQSAPLILELPPYHIPTLQGALWQSWSRVRLYMKKAGTFILAASIVIWVMMTFPQLPQEQAARYTGDPAELKQAELAHSVAGRLGKALEPVFAPIGFEWRTNIALLGGVAAKEVVV